MRWVPDRTGRFPRRPHYEAGELDHELGDLVRDFLRDRHGAVRFPISTDDLTVLIERYAILDPYADLQSEGDDVEGVTYFRPDGRPLVRIEAALSTDPRRANRYRTTLTHELTHVRLHAFLWNLERPSLPLLPAQIGASGPRCGRATILDASRVDWMEWQAGYGCGALLMPAGEVHDLMRTQGGAASPIPAMGDAADRAIATLASAFAVSLEAARIRLGKLGYFRPLQAQLLVI